MTIHKEILRTETMNCLERLVDHHTMSGVLGMLSEIASLKEQHVSETYQDKDLAKAWRKLELQLDKLHVNTPL